MLVSTPGVGISCRLTIAVRPPPFLSVFEVLGWNPGPHTLGEAHCGASPGVRDQPRPSLPALPGGIPQTLICSFVSRHLKELSDPPSHVSRVWAGQELAAQLQRAREVPAFPLWLTPVSGLPGRCQAFPSSHKGRSACLPRPWSPGSLHPGARVAVTLDSQLRASSEVAQAKAARGKRGLSLDQGGQACGGIPRAPRPGQCGHCHQPCPSCPRQGSYRLLLRALWRQGETGPARKPDGSFSFQFICFS